MGCMVLVFLLVTSLHCFALQWIFDPNQGKNVSIATHSDLIKSKLSWSKNGKKISAQKSKDIPESADVIRSGRGRGIEYPPSNNDPSTALDSTRISRQFSLLPFKDLVKSRREGPSGTFSKFSASCMKHLSSVHCNQSFFSSGQKRQHSQIQ